MKAVLCFGDSNTFGYNPVDGMRYPENVRWSGLLRKLIQSKYTLVEEGCNGRTTVYADPSDSWKKGDDYLLPCLNSHKPLDVVIIMLGSNDLKSFFHCSAKQAAENVGKLIDMTKEFTKVKQGFIPSIIVISPPHIGPKITESFPSFNEDAIEESKKFATYYKEISDQKGCIFFDAASYIEPSKIDSLHLSPEAHATLANKLAEIVMAL